MLAAQVSLCDFAYGEMGLEACLDAIFSDLKAFCQRKSLQLHMQALTKTLIGYSNTSQYPTGFLGSNSWSCNEPKMMIFKTQKPCFFLLW